VESAEASVDTPTLNVFAEIGVSVDTSTLDIVVSECPDAFTDAVSSDGPEKSVEFVDDTSAVDCALNEFVVELAVCGERLEASVMLTILLVDS